MSKPDETKKEAAKEFALENVIVTAVQIPGVKVNRKKFLAEAFAKEDISIDQLVESDPIQMGISQEKLTKLANKLILTRTSQSSIASFVAGIPGGLAMAATLPADILQFFGMSLRLAQELAYLYGAPDLWDNGAIDDDRVKNQLILYCGVMFGASGAVSGVRVLTTQIAKTTLKKLPQKALTKTFWYPIIKQIGKAVGIKVTKQTVATGVSKAVPILGGLISGGLNFASMMPMANRLLTALDESCFSYTEEEFEADLNVIYDISDDGETETPSEEQAPLKEKLSSGVKNMKTGFTNLLNKKGAQSPNTQAAASETNEVLDAIEKLAKLKDMGILTQEEFDAKKEELLGL